MSKVARTIEFSIFVFAVLLTSYLAFFIPTMSLNAYFGYDCEIGPFSFYCDLPQNNIFSVGKYISLFVFTCAFYIYVKNKYQESLLMPLVYLICTGILFCIIIDIILNRPPIYFSEIIYYLYYSAIILSGFSFIFIAIIMDVRIRHTLEYIVFFSIYITVTNFTLYIAYILGQHYPGAVSLFLLFNVFAFLIFPVHLMGVARIAALPTRLVPDNL